MGLEDFAGRKTVYGIHEKINNIVHDGKMMIRIIKRQS